MDDFELDHRAPVAIEEYGWDRIPVDGAEHDHAFARGGGETRTAVVTVDGDAAWWSPG